MSTVIESPRKRQKLDPANEPLSPSSKGPLPIRETSSQSTGQEEEECCDSRNYRSEGDSAAQSNSEVSTVSSVSEEQEVESNEPLEDIDENGSAYIEHDKSFESSSSSKDGDSEIPSSYSGSYERNMPMASDTKCGEDAGKDQDEPSDHASINESDNSSANTSSYDSNGKNTQIRSDKEREHDENVHNDMPNHADNHGADNTSRNDDNFKDAMEDDHDKDDGNNDGDEDKNINYAEDDSSAIEADCTGNDDDDSNYSEALKSSTRRSHIQNVQQTHNVLKHTRTHTRKTQINLRSWCKQNRKHTTSIATVTQRNLQDALNMLARKVLHQSEKTELIARLINAHKVGRDSRSQGRIASQRDTESIYTTQLETIALDILEIHKTSPNKAQIDLINLLFRSIGGTYETYLDANKITCIEDMDDIQWQNFMKSILDQMRFTAADCVLICADPEGAVHQQAVVDNNSRNIVQTKQKGGAMATKMLRGVQEYRKIYKEFWYTLGSVGLSTSASSAIPQSTPNSSFSNHNVNNNTGDNVPPIASRFAIEFINDLATQLFELVTMNQPDIRAAATLAILELARAALDKTNEIQMKLKVSNRQYNAATKQKKGASGGRKANSLKNQIDSFNRSCKDLEHLVLANIFQGIFMHRYRDTNQFIRAMCLDYLSSMILSRPDIFLQDRYLKYFGWMLSDKSAYVRLSCLNGLIAIFHSGGTAETQTFSAKSNKGPRSTSNIPIDLRYMENLIHRFLSRIVDCVIDVDYQVQEKAIELLLLLMQEDFLEEWDDEHGWNQVNLRALAKNTSPTVRRDALYFVIGQLETFDDHDESRSSKKGINTGLLSEKRQLERLDSIASWIAHSLSDGKVPMEKIQIHLADYVVHSLRDMPEHNSLATDWSMMLRAILSFDGNNLKHPNQSTQESATTRNRAELTKQRVLLQMLVCAADLEVGSITGESFLMNDVDSDYIAAKTQIIQSNTNETCASVKRRQTKKRKKKNEILSHEKLTCVLLKYLPRLLVSFKGDNIILRSLTSLPRYFRLDQLSVPQIKLEVNKVIQTLSDTFFESTDSIVLQNTALALTFLARGEHSRQEYALLQMKKTASALRDHLVQMYAERKLAYAKAARGKEDEIESSNNKSPSSSSSSSSAANSNSDIEHAILLCLKRFRILAKRWNVVDLLEVRTNDEAGSDGSFTELCAMIATVTKEQLQERTVWFNEDNEDSKSLPTIEVPDIWINGGQRIHSIVADSVSEALTLLLSVTAWKLRIAIDKEQEGLDDGLFDLDVEKQSILRFRDGLIKLTLLCFDQYIDDDEYDDVTFSSELLSFVDCVQAHAGRIANDLRSLFPKEWAETDSPLLRACAMQDDGHLIGGSVRYFKSKDDKFRQHNPTEWEDNLTLVDMILPICRGVCSNWVFGNRREAGAVLTHMTGSSKAVSEVVEALSRVLKKIDPVKLLEAHMACLRQCFEDWVDTEPEEPESDRPTEEEMSIFEEAEQIHANKFQFLSELSAKLSASLRVSKQRDAKLSRSLLAFVREGMRYSFSNEEKESEELILGSRLSFLTILSRYLTWICRKKDKMDVIREEFIRNEIALRNHPDFSEVHEDDLAVLASFRQEIGVTENHISSQSVASTSGFDDEQHSFKDSAVSRSSCGSLRRRLSHATSSVSSVRSRLSNQPSLSPLYEQEYEEEREESILKKGDEQSDDDRTTLPTTKKRKLEESLSRLGCSSALSLSTVAKTQATIEEEGSDEQSEEYESQNSSDIQ